jgi:hypothetical protein
MDADWRRANVARHGGGLPPDDAMPPVQKQGASIPLLNKFGGRAISSTTRTFDRNCGKPQNCRSNRDWRRVIEDRRDPNGFD